MKDYFLVMDGRANLDVEAALVIGIYSDISEERAIELFNADYTGMDACLFRHSWASRKIIPVQQGVAS